MHIFYDDTMQSGVNIQYGRMTLQDNFTVKDADEVVYSFLGENAKLFFYQIMPSENADEFIELTQNLQCGENVHFLTLLKDKKEVWHLMNIHIQKQQSPIGGNQYELDLHDVTRIERDHLSNLKKLDKYRMILSIMNRVYFEYEIETGQMVFYHYISLKAHPLFRGTIEEWYEEAIKYAAQEDKNLKAIEMLYHKILATTNHFETTISSGFLQNQHHIEKLHVTMEFVGKHHRQLIVGVIQRVDENEQIAPYYMTKAGVDAATGLLNKRAAIDYSEDILALSGVEKHYMLLLDIDDFKSINDGYGHDTGDRIITLVSNVLMEVLGGRGAVGRFGGDEFYILTDYIEDEEALRIFIRALNAKLRWDLERKGIEFQVTLSIGISLYPDNGTDYKELFAIADKALYIAKEKGKNRFIIYRPKLHDSIKVIGAGSGGISTNQEHAKALRIVVNDLLMHGKNSMGMLQTNLSIICETFGIDRINIYTGEDLLLFMTIGEEEGTFTKAFYMESKEYRNRFDEQNILRFNEVNNLRGECPEILKLYEERHISSVLQIVLPDVEHASFMISFECIERKRKWNENDTNYLNMLGNVIYDLLNR